MDSQNELQIENAKQQNDNDNPINVFAKLPHEILASNILLRLPITSIIQTSYTCRFFKSLSRDPHFVKLHHLANSSTNDKSDSCLILHSDYPIQNQLHFLCLSDKKVRKIDTPFANAMPEFTIIGSSNGVMCLVNTLFPDSIYLYNPFTRDHFEIRKNSKLECRIELVYGFGFDSVNDDYKAVTVASLADNDHYNPQSSMVWVYSLRRNEWRDKGIVPYRLENWSSPGVLVSGRLHWVSQSTKLNGHWQRCIGSCNLADDSFSEIHNPAYPRGGWHHCHLANLHGCLSVAAPVPPARWVLTVWIMREYGVSESWMVAYNIGPHIPVPRVIWNKVRILGVVGREELLLQYDERRLFSYDLRDGTCRELVCPGMPRIYRTTVHIGSLSSVPFLFL